MAHATKLILLEKGIKPRKSEKEDFMKTICFVLSICLMSVAGGCGTTNVFVKDDSLFAGKIAVMDFEYEPAKDAHELLYGSTWTMKAGETIADQIANSLFGYGVDVKRIPLSDEVKTLCEKAEYKKIGEMLGVDYIIFGNVNEHGAVGITGIVRGFSSFSLRCVTIETGKVAWSTAVSGSSFYSSPTTISGKQSEKVVEKLMRKIKGARS